jgi:RNA polymerase sigma-70 factor, ECF subfamily
MLCDLSLKIEDLTEPSDELLARAQRGDDEAFGLIFAEHHRFVYKFIFAMVGEPGRAEELTQETFLGAYRGIGALRGDAKLRTWLCAIAKNTVYKSIRADHRQCPKSDDALETFEFVDEKNPGPDAQFLNRELNQAIAAALAKLDADKRLIFTLKELQHLSYHEIAEITGHSVPKLKTDLHRAKAEMRRALRPYLEVNHEL